MPIGPAGESSQLGERSRSASASHRSVRCSTWTCARVARKTARPICPPSKHPPTVWRIGSPWNCAGGFPSRRLGGRGRDAFAKSDPVSGLALCLGTLPDAPSSGIIWAEDVSLLGTAVTVSAPPESGQPFASDEREQTEQPRKRWLRRRTGRAAVAGGFCLVAEKAQG